MFISQISIFLENVRGSLRNMTELLGEKEINLLAISIADTSGFGIVRVIVNSNEIERTLKILQEAGYIAKPNRVICVRVPHKPMGLAKVLACLDEASISVEYSYSFYKSNFNDACIIIRPSDLERSVDVLQSAGISMVSQHEVDGF
jgi:hypothetical protein